MSEVIDRPLSKEEQTAQSRLRIIDCDIHPSLRSRADLNEFLPKRWQEHLKTYGDHLRTPYIGTTPYPRSSPLICRRDAWPPNGDLPGSDLAFMRKQHLDPYDVEFGILQVLDLFIFSQQNLECGAAIQRAINEWQLAHWTHRDPRLRLRSWSARTTRSRRSRRSTAARKSANTSRSTFRRAPTSRSAAGATGRFYARAQELGLPIGIHTGGYGGYAPTGGGWPSYYCEEHHSNAHTMSRDALEHGDRGCARAFPEAEVRVHRGRFGLGSRRIWRMDQHFERFRSEVPHLKRKPSEYVRDHFWFTTQPIDEPDEAKHLRQLIEWVGIDRLLFSSDYPHWDYDDARFAFKTPLTDAERKKIFNTNARAVYKF